MVKAQVVGDVAALLLVMGIGLFWSGSYGMIEAIWRCIATAEIGQQVEQISRGENPL